MSDTTVTRTSDRELLVTRSFRAPPDLVYEVYTDPRHVEAWWVPKSCGGTAKITAEVRLGGAYRYVTRLPNGQELVFVGKYVEVTPPSRLVYTQIFEPMAAAGEAVVTVTFEPKGAGTLLTSRERYPSKDALDAAIASGMEQGMAEVFEQLDALAASLR